MSARRWRRWAAPSAICASIACATAALAGGGAYEITSNAIGPGGGVSTSRTYVVEGTIADVSASSTLSGGTFSLEGGYVTLAPSLACSADLNGDGIVNGADMGALLGAWGTDDECADLSGSGLVGAEDLAILLGAWNG